MFFKQAVLNVIVHLQIGDECGDKSSAMNGIWQPSPSPSKLRF